MRHDHHNNSREKKHQRTHKIFDSSHKNQGQYFVAKIVTLIESPFTQRMHTQKKTHRNPNVFQSIIHEILLRFSRFCCIAPNDNCIRLLCINIVSTEILPFPETSTRGKKTTNRSAAAYDAFTSFFDGKN